MIDNTNVKIEAQLNQLKGEITELKMQNQEFQTQLLAMREQNEAMEEQNETLTGLVEELATRCDKQLITLLRYQQLLCMFHPILSVLMLFSVLTQDYE